MIDPNLNLDQAIEKMEHCLIVRQMLHPSHQDNLLLEEYMNIDDDTLRDDIAFFKQLKLGWVKIDNLYTSQAQIDQAYDKAYFEPTGNGDYRDIQGYAQVECPQFVTDQFAIKLWKSVGFLRCLPNKTIPKHKDMGRVAALLIPCKGDQQTIPLTFWNDQNEKISEVIVDGPTLINTTIQHSVDETSEEERTNFNLCFDFPLTFESVADILVRRGGIK